MFKCISISHQTKGAPRGDLSISLVSRFTKLYQYFIRKSFKGPLYYPMQGVHNPLIRPEFFHLLIYKPSDCNFPESRKKIKLISNIILLFYPPTLIIICFVEKNNIFLRFCLCIFENDTVKSDCFVQIFRKMIKYLKIYTDCSFTLLVLLFFWRYLKEKL